MSVVIPPGYYDQGTRRGLRYTGRVTLDTTPRAILIDNDGRMGAVVKNASAVNIYVGEELTDLTSNGHIMGAGDTLSVSGPSALFGVAASSTALVSWLDETIR